MYHFIHQHNASSLTHLPKGKNMLNFSMLNGIAQPINFRSFSIKYVVKGCETYHVNNYPFSIQKGEYLLANTTCKGRVDIDSKAIVHGICIDLAPETIDAVIASFVDPENDYPLASGVEYFHGHSFPENKFDADKTFLGKLLTQTGNAITVKPDAYPSPSSIFYYQLAEALVKDHTSVMKQMYALPVIRHQTRKDVYRRLCHAREFLESQLSASLHIQDAARQAMMSEYHFYRMFKLAFGQSPHQYRLNQRLQRACKLLKSGHYSVSEISLQTGFADSSSFSKAFKHHFGKSPMRIVFHDDQLM